MPAYGYKECHRCGTECDSYCSIAILHDELQKAGKALSDIKALGIRQSGYGFTCARMAEAAIKELKCYEEEAGG